MPPSAHIPTIVLTYLFDTTTPDFAEIQTYTERLFLDPDQRRVLDHIFYERLIRGYARFGMCDKMMGAARRMLRERKGGLSWGGLRDVVVVLGREGRREEVKEVVEGLKNGGWSRGGGRGKRAEAEFWEVVEGIGLG